jgi:hypothetical protein
LQISEAQSLQSRVPFHDELTSGTGRIIRGGREAMQFGVSPPDGARA